MNAVSFYQFYSYSLFHIHLYIHKMLIIEPGHFGIREYILGQDLTETTPFGMTIQKDQLLLTFSLIQLFFPGALRKFDSHLLSQSSLRYPEHKKKNNYTNPAINPVVFPIFFINLLCFKVLKSSLSGR